MADHRDKRAPRAHSPQADPHAGPDGAPDDDAESHPACGTLYVVATPIGNLEDLSPRARRILGEVSLLAAEDTRASRGLLQHCQLNTPLISYQDYNEEQRVPHLIERLLAGQDIALVSDAGVPGISDPGFRLAREAQARGIKVIGIPGPCAAITALSVAGLPTDRFLFLGFPPPRSARRRATLESVREEPGTLVFYESPLRILETLADVAAVLPGRVVALGRELTKFHEELVRGTPEEVMAHLEANQGERKRGEMTLLIEGAGRNARAGGGVDLTGLDASASLKKLADVVAQVLGVPRRDAYKALSRLKEKAQQAESSADGSDETAS